MTVLGVVSGKGGVGKTTIVANLACALTKLGYDITVIDANLTTPHLGLQLGVSLLPKTLHDVMRGEDIFNAIYYHPLGFKFVIGGLSLESLSGVEVSKLMDIISDLSRTSDFLLLDSAPGFGREATSAIQAAEDILIVTNPEMQAVVDALKVKRLAESLNKRVLGIVLNRVKKSHYQLSKEEVEGITECPVLAQIPEDENVPKAIALKLPVVELIPNSPAAIEILKLSYYLVGKTFPTYSKFGFLGKLIDWLRK
jgi:septum site-determining protein MinD